MTSILQELQADYERRAQQAAVRPQEALESPVKRRATRTYSGEALERRRAWGRFWGQSNSRAAAELRREAV